MNTPLTIARGRLKRSLQHTTHPAIIQRAKWELMQELTKITGMKYTWTSAVELMEISKTVISATTNQPQKPM